MRGFFCTSLRISAPIRLLSGWLKLPQNPLQKFFPCARAHHRWHSPYSDCLNHKTLYLVGLTTNTTTSSIQHINSLPDVSRDDVRSKRVFASYLAT